MESARPRITVLKILLPVKYNTANGYSFGDVYKKSTRRATFLVGNLATTKLFVRPLDNTSNIIFCSNNESMNFLKTSLFSEVMITSISPEVIAFRR